MVSKEWCENQIIKIRQNEKAISNTDTDLIENKNKLLYEKDKWQIKSAWQRGEDLVIGNVLVGVREVKIQDIFENTFLSNCDNIQFIKFNPWKQVAIFKAKDKFIQVSAGVIMATFYKQEDKQ